ncbi:PAS domain S-box protein [Phaeospirillum tilakii]|uniref:histidine kinase n=1 Tax=Phaeospirillum tilakii TaxID=741673 RepID=A0ABW5CCR6_9PROT
MLTGFGGLLAHDLVRSYHQNYEIARRDSDNLTRLLERHILSSTEKIEVVLNHTALDFAPILAAPGRTDPRQARAILQAWADFVPEVREDGLRVTDARGLEVFTGREPLVSARVLIGDRPYFQYLRDHPESGLIASPPIRSRFSGQWQISLARPVVAPNGHFLGVALSSLRAEYFQALFATLDVGRAGTITLFDTEMNFLARLPALPERLGQRIDCPELVAALAAGSTEGVLEFPSPLDGIRRQFVYRKLDRLPYVLVIGRAPSEFLSGWTRQAVLYAIGFTGLAATVLAFLHLFHGWTERSRRVVLQIFEQSHDGIVVTDLTGRIIAANPGFARITGHDPAELPGQSLQILRAARHSQGFYARILASLRGPGGWRGEIWIRHRGGGERPLLASISAIRDRRRRLTHYVAVVSDSSELYRIRDQAWETRLRLEEAQRLTGLGSWDFDLVTGRIIWSDTAFAIVGRDPASYVPELDPFLTNLLDPDDRAAFEAFRRHTRETGEGEATFRLRRPDGEIRHVLMRARVFHDARGAAVRAVGAIIDVTEREQANADLGLFRRIFDSAGQGIAISDAEGRLIFVNKAFLRLTGYRREAVIGRPHGLVHPAPPDLVSIGAEEGDGSEWCGLLDIRRADGSRFTSLGHMGSVFDSHGRPQFRFNIFSDYTPELTHQRELRDALDAAEQASRAKSAFLAHMSHELRTPLNAILGFSQFIEMDPELTAPQRDRVGAIHSAGRHLLDLISEILDLARIESGQIDLTLQPIGLDEPVRDCLELIGPEAERRQVAIEQGIAADTPAVLADPTRLKQALVNLLSNAVKYNHPGGRVRLETRALAPDRLRLRVIDTGCGIPPERLAELFTPFNRLGAEYTRTEGTGIGLALTRRIVEAMNGRVGVESVPGQGSVFWIDLPAA